MHQGFHYRKRPVAVQAVRFTLEDLEERCPAWLKEDLKEGIVFYRFDIVGDHDWKMEWFVKTLEGEHKITPGDYLIRGIKGELYPCKPDIFKETYDSVSITQAHEVKKSRQG